MVLNEKKYAIKVLETHEYTEKLTTTLSIISKYLYYCHGKSDGEILDALDNFVKKVQPDYNKVSWLKYFSSVIKFTKKHPLIEIDSIPITQKELDTISQLKTMQVKKVLFSLLCYAKYYNMVNPNNNSWVNVDSKVIFKSANVQKKVIDQYKMYYDLGQDGYLATSRNMNTLNKQVNIIDESGDAVLFISDFRDLGYEYLLYNGENYTRCEKCGRLIKNNKAGTKKYCSDCNNWINVEMKTINCIECGTEVVIDSKDNNTDRCVDCYILYRRQYKLQKERERRKKMKFEDSVDSTN